MSIPVEELFEKLDAIKSLLPTAVVYGYHNNPTWDDAANTALGLTKPTDAAIDAEVTRLRNEYTANEYQRKRAREYPDFRDYLDGIVKDDTAQINAYKTACQAIKTKYPKG